MKNFPILSIHQFDEQGAEQEFYMNHLSEHLRKYHDHIMVPHKHDFYLSILFTEGEGWHEINFRRYPVKPGALFFLRPGQTHHWTFSIPAEGRILFHSQAFFHRYCTQHQPEEFPFFRTRDQQEYLQLDELQITDFDRQLNEIYREYTSEQRYKYRKAGSLLHGFYIDTARICPEEPMTPTPYARYCTPLDQLIEEHYLSERSPEFYAGQLHVSVRHLNRICRSCYGMSFGEMIIARVVLEAKRLLSGQEWSMKEIADKLGFEEYAYFSRVFKQQTGETPRDFREKYRE